MSRWQSLPVAVGAIVALFLLQSCGEKKSEKRRADSIPRGDFSCLAVSIVYENDLTTCTDYPQWPLSSKESNQIRCTELMAKFSENGCADIASGTKGCQTSREGNRLIVWFQGGAFSDPSVVPNCSGTWVTK